MTMYVVTNANGDELVATDDGCPCCDERRADRLLWSDDGERLTCVTCGCVYGL